MIQVKHLQHHQKAFVEGRMPTFHFWMQTEGEDSLGAGAESQAPKDWWALHLIASYAARWPQLVNTTNIWNHKMILTPHDCLYERSKQLFLSSWKNDGAPEWNGGVMPPSHPRCECLWIQRVHLTALLCTLLRRVEPPHWCLMCGDKTREHSLKHPPNIHQFSGASFSNPMAFLSFLCFSWDPWECKVMWFPNGTSTESGFAQSEHPGRWSDLDKGAGSLLTTTVRCPQRLNGSAAPRLPAPWAGFTSQLWGEESQAAPWRGRAKRAGNKEKAGDKQFILFSQRLFCVTSTVATGNLCTNVFLPPSTRGAYVSLECLQWIICCPSSCFSVGRSYTFDLIKNSNLPRKMWPEVAQLLLAASNTLESCGLLLCCWVLYQHFQMKLLFSRLLWMSQERKCTTCLRQKESAPQSTTPLNIYKNCTASIGRQYLKTRTQCSFFKKDLLRTGPIES